MCQPGWSQDLTHVVLEAEPCQELLDSGWLCRMPTLGWGRAGLVGQSRCLLTMSWPGFVTLDAALAPVPCHRAGSQEALPALPCSAAMFRGRGGRAFQTLTCLNQPVNPLLLQCVRLPSGEHVRFVISQPPTAAAGMGADRN